MRNLLALTLLGTPAVRLNGNPVVGFRSMKGQALLYYLAVTGHAHTRPTLAGLLWGDQPEAAARASLSKCLSNLHELLGDLVLIERQQVAFNRAQPYQLDTECFERDIKVAPSPATVATLEAALALYRGDFLAGFYVRNAPDFEQWVLVQRTHYREALLQGLHARATYAEQQGDLLAAIAHTRRLLALEPWREEAHRQLMTQLMRNGQRAAALAQFESCRQVLADELGVTPDAETLAVVAAIRTGELANKETRRQGEGESAKTKISLSSPLPISSSLPIPPTPLIGRVRELAELGAMLNNPQCRLITITGVGGMGKSRLALAVAAAQSGKFQHGAVFVPLAGVSSAQFLPQAILNALDVPLQGKLSPQQQVRAALYHQERLLVLDNYEQLLPDVELLLDILHYAPGVTLLVTSRERLALPAEYLHELTGLAYPAQPPQPQTAASVADFTHYTAVELFLQRVRQLQPRITLCDKERAAIVRICQISEGMPLAVELAAALVRQRAIGEIARAMEGGAGLAAGRLRGIPERHRSMWTTFDYSWQLLAPEEQRVFCALAVFRGGFQAEAAQAVVNTSADMLALLVDKSLLRYQRAASAGGRYEMHELLRQFAGQKLDERREQATILHSHSAYFLNLAETAEAQLHGSQQKVWLDRLEGEHDNLRAAISHCLNTAPAMALQVAAALSEFWYLRGYFNEGRYWLTQALDRNADVFTVTSGRAMVGASKLAWIQGDLDQATALAAQSLDLFRSLEDMQNLAKALNLSGLIALYQNELKQAKSLFEQALAVRRNLGNQFDMAGILLDLGLVEIYQHNYAQAKALLLESLAIGYVKEDRFFIGVCQMNLGCAELYGGNYKEAASYFREAVSISLNERDQESVAGCLEGFAAIVGTAHDNQNNLQAAATLLGAAQTLRAAIGVPLPLPDQPYYEANLALLRTHIDAASFTEAWAAGVAMSVEQAVAYALSISMDG